MRKNLLLITALLSLFTAFVNEGVQAQDPHFSQFYANPLYLNPAFAGSHRCPRVVMNQRNQWPNIQGTYVTSSFSYDQHISAIAGGLGILVMRDDAGDGTLEHLRASLIYSYFLPVTKTFSVKVGVEATYFQKSLNWNKLTFGDQIDRQLGFIYQTAEGGANNGIQSVNGIDFSAGMLGYSKSFYIGGAVHHLTEPNESFVGDQAGFLPMKYTGHMGAIIATDNARQRRRSRRRNKNALPASSISPNILYKRQKDFQELFLGVYVTKGPIVGGIWYRNVDAFIALVGLQFNNFRFGYSYDVTISRLAANSAGAHEVSASILFDCRPKKKKFAPVSCPSF